MDVAGNDVMLLNVHGDVLNAEPESDAARASLVAELKSRGNAAYKGRRMKEADVLYSKALEHDPDNAKLYGNRSMVRCIVGQHAEALADAESATAHDPAWAKGYFRKAQALSKLKRHNAAAQAYDAAAERDPKSAAAMAKAAAKERAAAEAASKRRAEEKKESKAAATKRVVTQAAPAAGAGAAKRTKAAAGGEGKQASGEMRGYKTKVMADGRVAKTSFFDMERSKEELELIGDIKPKKLTGEAAKAAQATFVGGVGAAGSCWNQGAGTYEEVDCTKWGKARITELLLGAAHESDGLRAEVTAVNDLLGDATVAVVKGRKRFIFDFSFTLDWRVVADGGGGGEGKAEGKQAAAAATAVASGTLSYPDFSADEDINDLERQCSVKAAGDGAAKRFVADGVKAKRGAFQGAIAAQLQVFVDELHEK